MTSRTNKEWLALRRVCAAIGKGVIGHPYVSDYHYLKLDDIRLWLYNWMTGSNLAQTKKKITRASFLKACFDLGPKDDGNVAGVDDFLSQFREKVPGVATKELRKIERALGIYKNGGSGSGVSITYRD